MCSEEGTTSSPITWKNSHGWGIEEQLETLRDNTLHPSLSIKMCGLRAGFTVIIFSLSFTNEEPKVTEERGSAEHVAGWERYGLPTVPPWQER